MHYKNYSLSEDALMLQEQAKECYDFIIFVVKNNQELFKDEIEVIYDQMQEEFEKSDNKSDLNINSS